MAKEMCDKIIIQGNIYVSNDNTDRDINSSKKRLSTNCLCVLKASFKKRNKVGNIKKKKKKYYNLTKIIY